MIKLTEVDKYQIIGPLGSGHFGQVYRAFDRALRVEKAIKILNAKDPSEFLLHLQEAQILRKCNHKHIVQINEANIFKVRGESRVVLDLEFIPGGSLEGALKARWVSVREAVSHIRGALLGLEHAHSQGVLHRDIKPGNILLTAAGSKLSDFGLATEPGAGLFGSPNGYTTHLPPEFFNAPATSVLTDIYATGMTLFRAASNIADWRAVSGALPNARKCIEAGTLIKVIGYGEFIPHPLRRIINQACATDPARRFASAHDFGQKLDKLRFNIDWARVSDTEWVGYLNGEKFGAVVNQSCELTVTRNGRRMTTHCCKFPTMSAAVSAMHAHVADTTFV